jgi:hypothetical protein
MISRRSARILGETYQRVFSRSKKSTSRHNPGSYYIVILGNVLYDFFLILTDFVSHKGHVEWKSRSTGFEASCRDKQTH